MKHRPLAVSIVETSKEASARGKAWARKRLLVIFLGGALVFVGGFLLIPIMHAPFAYEAAPPPAPYEAAVAAIQAVIDATPSEVGPAGRPRLLQHGKPSEQVFVLLHGLSNCPEQFAALGEILFERGHNVFIPRTPYHGESDLMTDSLARLTAGEMLAAANSSLDLARGLGRKVVVAGLSVNGTTAAWIGQNRADVDRAVLLAPFLAPAGVPGWATGPLERLLLRMPNIFLWWDPVAKQNLAGPPHCYPRFPTRIIGEVMLLGRDVLRESRSTAPRCKSLVVVTTASDTAVNTGLVEALVANWKNHRPDAVKTFNFPADQEIPHDFIDPNQPNQRTQAVYHKLVQWMEGASEPAP